MLLHGTGCDAVARCAYARLLAARPVLSLRPARFPSASITSRSRRSPKWKVARAFASAALAQQGDPAVGHELAAGGLVEAEAAGDAGAIDCDELRLIGAEGINEH